MYINNGQKSIKCERSWRGRGAVGREKWGNVRGFRGKIKKSEGIWGFWEGTGDVWGLCEGKGGRVDG